MIKQPIYIDIEVQQKIKNESIENLWAIMLDKSNVVHQKHSGLSTYFIIANAILNQQVESVGRDNPDVIVVDPLDQFLDSPSTNELFHDNIHLTPNGNKLLAKIIDNSIAN